MLRQKLKDDFKEVKAFIGSSDRFSDIFLDDNVVSFCVSVPGESVIEGRLLKFEIFYQDADTYPKGGAILTLEESDGFEDIVQGANALMQKNSQLLPLFRMICENLKVLEDRFDFGREISQRSDASDEFCPFSRNLSQVSNEGDSCDADITPSVGLDTIVAHRRSEQDLEEVRRHGYGGGFYHSVHFLPIWLSIDVARLRLHPETAAAWRLDPAATLLISGRFLSTYPVAKSAEDLEAAVIDPFRVRAVRPDDHGRWWEAGPVGSSLDAAAAAAAAAAEGFGLQWTLNDRLKGFFRILAAQARRFYTKRTAHGLIVLPCGRIGLAFGISSPLNEKASCSRQRKGEGGWGGGEKGDKERGGRARVR